MHVVLYTYSTCSFCSRAKELLDGLGVEYVEEVLDGDRAMLARLRRLTGESAMPYTMIDGEFVGGLAKLEALAAAGAFE